eukprot:GHVT01060732.1.p2 GENE.GHVT01060732.1~~GHVT01060732.1.p2  ORF type:complete len:202 (-),score=75.77 GHVT01060732.1:364-969(-)
MACAFASQMAEECAKYGSVEAVKAAIVNPGVGCIWPAPSGRAAVRQGPPEASKEPPAAKEETRGGEGGGADRQKSSLHADEATAPASATEAEPRRHSSGSGTAADAEEGQEGPEEEPSEPQKPLESDASALPAAAGEADEPPAGETDDQHHREVRIFVRFQSAGQAVTALGALAARWFNGRPIIATLYDQLAFKDNLLHLL